MRSFAALSPRSMRFASSTSSAAVSSSCLPTSFMNSVTESVVATVSKVRSSAASSESSASGVVISMPRASSSPRSAATSSSSRSCSIASAARTRDSTTPSSSAPSISANSSVVSSMVLMFITPSETIACAAGGGRQLATSRASPRARLLERTPSGVNSRFLPGIHNASSTKRQSAFTSRISSTRLAVGLEQPRRADELDAALRARGRDVDPVLVEDEREAARRLLPARARERDDHDRRLLPLELVDGADAHALGHRLPQRPHLRVVRRHDEDVVDAERPRRAVLVRVVGAEQRADRRPRPRPPPRARAARSPRARPAGRRARSRPRRSAARTSSSHSSRPA